MSSSVTPGVADGSTGRYERLLEVQTLMARVSREVGPALDLEHVLKIILEAVREIVPVDGGAISLLEGDTLTVMASEPDFDSRELTGYRLSLDQIWIRPARSDDLPTDPLAPPASRALAEAHGLRSFLTVPLVCLGDVIGVLSVYAKEPAVFDEHHEVLLEGLATQVAGAIESARRYRVITELETLKSDFIARVSHELRTPITIMSGFLSTLLMNHERLDEETRHGMLQRVDVATARLSGLIDQLLMLTRLEAGVVAATIEPVDVATALEDVRRQSTTPETVTIECTPGLRVITDRALFLRGMGFVVDNALKYAGACTIVATEDTVEVTDAGPGIPVERRSQVFERFTRATEDTTIPGMGIGLPIARTLLAAAGAELTIQDNPDGVGCRMVARWV